MEGWIKLYRKLQDNKLWTCEPFTRGQAWVDLLLLANHEYGYFFVRDHKIEVQRGQVGWSENKLAERWSWSRSKVRKFIKQLEKEQQVIQQKSRSYSIIELINYEIYQEKEQQVIQQQNNRKTTEKQQKNTNKNEKEGKEGKEIVYIEKDFLPIFERWLKYKKDKRQSYKNEDSIKAAYNKLYKLAGGDFELADKIVEQSLANNWDGLFELKNKNKQLKKFTEDDF